MHTPDHAVATIAAGQHGMVSRRQALAAGLTRRAIDHRLAQGRLHPEFRGVYAVGHRAPAPFARESAALLACGDGSVLSHASAAALWRFAAADPSVVHVLHARPDPGRRSGIRVHLAEAIDPRDVRRVEGLPVTSPARTLVDLAATSGPHALARAFDEAKALRLISDAELARAVSRAVGRRGIVALRELLGEGPTMTRSEAERRLLDLIRIAGLPRPETNARLLRYEVDLLWRERGLVVEVDGYAFHASRTAFERDRLRDAQLQAAGLRVMRVTWRQIVQDSHALVARIAQALARP